MTGITIENPVMVFVAISCNIAFPSTGYLEIFVKYAPEGRKENTMDISAKKTSIKKKDDLNCAESVF